MLKPEALLMIDEMTALFPKWGRTDAETVGWVRIFMGVSETATARKAINRLWETTQRGSPSPGQFAVALEAIRPRGPMGEDTGPTLGFTGVFVQCVEAPEQFPRRLGHFEQIVYPLKAQVPADPGVVIRQATNQCRAQEGLYGGVWRVVEQATPGKMIELRTGLLAKAGLLAPESKGKGVKGLAKKIGEQDASLRKQIDENRRKLLKQAPELKGGA